MAFTRSDVGPRMTSEGPVDLSAAEKDAVIAEWEADQAARAAAPGPRNLAAEIDELKARLATAGIP